MTRPSAKWSVYIVLNFWIIFAKLFFNGDKTLTGAVPESADLVPRDFPAEAETAQNPDLSTGYLGSLERVDFVPQIGTPAPTDVETVGVFENAG